MTEIGAILNNGALVVAKQGEVILALWKNRPHAYVTWKVDQEGHPYLGHYFNNIVEAAKDFDDRIHGRV